MISVLLGKQPYKMGSTYHKGKYLVIIRKNIEETRKEITICIEKVYDSDSLRITLSDEDDPCFLCLLNVNRCDYEELKKQQGLLIDFDNFPGQLVRLLQQCSANNMFLIVQQSNPLQYYFEIVEHNEFKRLIHLSLKTSPANDEEIKKHMTDCITNIKKTVSLLQNKTASSESAWQEKCSNLEKKLDELMKIKQMLEEDKQRMQSEYQEIIRRERDKLSQEKHQIQKNAEDTIKTETFNMKDIVAKKERKLEEINYKLHQTQENLRSLETTISEKNQRISLLEQEVQSSHIEVATLKARNAVLERDTGDRDSREKMMRTKLNEAEKNQREMMDQIRELNATITTLRNEKNQLEDRLTISESLVNRNNAAVQSSSEQVMKANQIITKQHSDLVEMKEKLLTRTHIALEQEKVIERQEKEIENLRVTETEVKEKIDKLTTEVELLKCKCEESEKMLKEKDEAIRNNHEVIQWLHKKVENLECSPRRSDQISKHSTPQEHSTRVSSRDFEENYHQDLTDDSVNFYGVSRRSNVTEESPILSLDPKYLRPATDDGDSGKPTSRRSATTTSSRDKENKCVNLPPVDYREKKSGKIVAYKRTPVSAYYPKP